MKKRYLNLSQNRNNIYSIAVKFRNLSSRIDALLSNGKFWEFSKNQQERLLVKLRLLFEKLSGFNPKYALKIAAAAMCFGLISANVEAQPTFGDFPPESPFLFNSIDGQSIANWDILDGAFADIDGDNDDDAILLYQCAGNSGSAYAAYFQNNNGVFEELSGSANPFASYCISYWEYDVHWGATGIDMADFDGDGDLDAIITHGNSGNGYIIPYQINAGGSFEMNNSSDLYYNSQLWRGHQAKFGDVDGDGDLDIVGTCEECGSGMIGTLFQNSDHSFDFSIATPYDFPLPPPLSDIHINMADMDGDGDDDLFLFKPGISAPTLPEPDATGFNILYVENVSGPLFVPNYSNQEDYPLPLADMSSFDFPLLADLDGVGDVDVFTPGEADNSDYAFQNIRASAVPVSPLIALLLFAATGFGIFRKNRKKKKA